MLIIRRQQMEAFERHLMDDFVHRLTTYFSPGFPELSAADIADRIRTRVTQAQEFHILRECDIARFVELSLDRPAMPAMPRELLAILTRYGMDPGKKLDAMQRWLMSSNRVTVQP